MKKTILLLTFIAIAYSFSAKAQEIGGNDILLIESPTDFANSKISVADNGWIYVLTHHYQDDFSSSGWALFRSKDEGVTYDRILQFPFTDIQIRDCDMVVTGKNATDIAVWVACASLNTISNEGNIIISKFDSDGTWIANPLDKKHIHFDPKHIAITTDYRSPSNSTTNNTFSIACACVTKWKQTGEDQIIYSYSLDGGDNFNSKLIYNVNGIELGKIDLSYGVWEGGIGGVIGIVFETDNDGAYWDIGLMVCTTSFNTFHWTAPFTVSELDMAKKQKCRNPKIQYKNNITTPWGDKFVVTMDDYSDPSVEDIFVVVGHGVSAYGNPNNGDFAFYNLNGDGRKSSADLSYDKAYDNFLLTYIDDESLVYKVARYNNVRSDNWTTIGKYTINETPGDYALESPVVDINPAKKRACFSWTYVDMMGNIPSIYADTEWSTVDVEIHKTANNSIDIYPNPAQDIVNITMPESDKYTATLYDLNGKALNEFKFNSDTYELDINALPAGVYILKVNSDKKIYSSKIIKK